ncbi:hypothetical protein [Bradyrhizobium sp. cf659]|nr:hypothetical protein [Bradyrhizobium sp. cf659]SFH84055.1 hypothetical protein SAMN04487925_101730 [Bradyrhizobium sp. cf659]
MLLFIGPRLFVLLFYAAVRARRAGLSGTRARSLSSPARPALLS